MITGMPEFRGYDPATGAKVPGKDPYNAAQYMPYYQGAFDQDGKLIDSTDPMLYWLVPINQTQPDWSSRREYREKGGFKYYFDDYLSGRRMEIGDVFEDELLRTAEFMNANGFHHYSFLSARRYASVLLSQSWRGG